MTLLARAALARARAGAPDAAREELIGLLSRHVDDDAVLGALEALADEAADEAATLSQLAALRDLAGDDYSARYANRLGEMHSRKKRLEDAVVWHRRAVSLAGHERRYHDSLAFALNALANSMYSDDRYSEAAALYREATEHRPKDAALFDNLAGAVERDSSHGSTLASLEAALPAMLTAARLEPRSDSYRRQVAKAQRLVAAGNVYGAGVLDLAPQVTPLIVELASDLVSLVDGGGEALMPEVVAALTAMRDAVRKRYGVLLPGVRFRGNDGVLPPSSYLILLHEVPLVRGTVARGKAFVTGSIDSLTAADPGVTAASHPRTGADGGWVSLDARERLSAGIGDALSEIEFIVAHVTGVCERNLVDFVGVGEVRSMVVEHATEDAQDFILDTPDALRRLSGVVRGLLCEFVPVREFRSICARFHEMAPQGPSIVSLVEAMRTIAGVREHVFPSPERARLCTVDSDLGATIEECIVHTGPEPELAMSPESCQGALAAVRSAVARVDASAILVEKPLVRHFMRKLVELEWPNLRVIARSELDSIPDDRIVASIGLEG